MKFEIEDLDHIKVFINKYYKNNLEDCEEDIKKIFLKLRDYYNIEVSGFYVVDVYEDEHYGFFIDIKKEDVDYYYDGGIDMRVAYRKQEFLYEIDDYYYFNPKKYLDIIFIDDKMYAKVNRNLNKLEMMEMIEMTNKIKV